MGKERCERCPKWGKNPGKIQKVIIPGVGERNLCPTHNPWVTEGKDPGETLVWREDPKMQGAK